MQRRIAAASCGGFCEVCGKELWYSYQGAHRIANTKTNRSIWGSWIIDHPMNMAIVCSLKCNDKCNIGNNKGECLKLVEKILQKEMQKWK